MMSVLGRSKDGGCGLCGGLVRNDGTKEQPLEWCAECKLLQRAVIAERMVTRLREELAEAKDKIRFYSGEGWPDEEYPALIAISEAQRTPEQGERMGFLVAERILEKGLSYEKSGQKKAMDELKASLDIRYELTDQLDEAKARIAELEAQLTPRDLGKGKPLHDSDPWS